MNRTGCRVSGGEEQVQAQGKASRWQQQGQTRARTNEPAAAALSLDTNPCWSVFQKRVDSFELRSAHQDELQPSPVIMPETS